MMVRTHWGGTSTRKGEMVVLVAASGGVLNNTSICGTPNSAANGPHRHLHNPSHTTGGGGARQTIKKKKNSR